MLAETDTLITYPDGLLHSSGRVVHVEPLGDGRTAVILDRTAFHPVDTAWPDQPSDRGTLTVDAVAHPVAEALTGGIHEGRLFLGPDLPVRTGTDGWVFVVAHLVPGAAIAEGAAAEVVVDGDYRSALSAGHTACHLAALALDAALAAAWTKDVMADSLGSPAFDALAIQSSRIGEYESVDVYRIGKSLRRKGFDPAVLSDPAAVAAAANAQLASWVDAGGAVRIERDDSRLSARRRWVCDLPQGTATIDCGGTHVDDVGAFAAIEVELAVADVEGGRELTMTTRSRMR